MTICIAAACQCYDEKNPPALVFVLDKSISLGGMTSIETGVKGARLSDWWNVMFAGDDVSHARTVVSHACDSILQSQDESHQKVCSAVVEAYQRVRRKQIQDIYLSSLGWNLEEFRARGKEQLPESEFSRLLNEIQKYDLGCEFLIGGFDPNYKASALIFQVVNPGTSIPSDIFNFAAIGSGAPAAYAYLARKEQHKKASLPRTVYNTIGAKVFAEKAIGIGKQTNALVFQKGGTSGILKHVEQIREIWEKEEDEVQPKNLEERIKKLLAFQT